MGKPYCVFSVESCVFCSLFSVRTAWLSDVDAEFDISWHANALWPVDALYVVRLGLMHPLHELYNIEIF